MSSDLADRIRTEIYRRTEAAVRGGRPQTEVDARALGWLLNVSALQSPHSSTDILQAADQLTGNPQAVDEGFSQLRTMAERLGASHAEALVSRAESGIARIALTIRDEWARSNKRGHARTYVAAMGDSQLREAISQAVTSVREYRLAALGAPDDPVAGTPAQDPQVPRSFEEDLRHGPVDIGQEQTDLVRAAFIQGLKPEGGSELEQRWRDVDAVVAHLQGTLEVTVGLRKRGLDRAGLLRETRDFAYVRPQTNLDNPSGATVAMKRIQTRGADLSLLQYEPVPSHAVQDVLYEMRRLRLQHDGEYVLQARNSAILDVAQTEPALRAVVTVWQTAHDGARKGPELPEFVDWALDYASDAEIEGEHLLGHPVETFATIVPVRDAMSKHAGAPVTQEVLWRAGASQARGAER